MNRLHRLTSLLPVVLYLFLAILYMLAIPPGESPDEPSHLQCIEQVTEYGRIPIIEPLPQGTNWWDRERIISGLVCAHMPLYYFGAGLTQRVVEWMTQIPAHYEFPPNDPNFPASPAMFSHSEGDGLPNAGEPAPLTVLRLESILMGLVTLAGAYILTKRLTGGNNLASLFAMTLVAGWPQFVFMSRAINNDSLATALSVAALTVLIGFNRPSRFVWASALSALATLAKLTLFVSALGVAAIFIIELISADRNNRQQYIKPALGSLLIYGSLATLILLHPTLRSHLEWSQATMSNINPNASKLNYWSDVIALTAKSGWGRFGWMSVSTPDWQAQIWWGFLLVTGLIGVAFNLRRGKAQTRLTLMSGTWVACILTSYVRINLDRFQPQFRYIFAVIPVLAALAAVGLFSLLDSYPRIRRLATPALGVLLLLANLQIIFHVLVPTYS